MRETLQRRPCAVADVLMVGDSEADYDAAVANGVSFLLRRTSLNLRLQERHRGAAFNDLAPA